MMLVDTNVLLYVVDENAAQHSVALRWIESTLSSGTTVIFPWLVLIGFLRLSTGRSFFTNPLSSAAACELVDQWLATDSALIAVPDKSHLERVDEIVSSTGVGGNIINDAHLAAIAQQYDATVISFDNDFSRFPGVRWQQPAA